MSTIEIIEIILGRIEAEQSDLEARITLERMMEIAREVIETAGK